MPLSFDSERYSVQPLTDRSEKNVIRIGYLGRISEEKGIDIILQALKEMNESGGLGVELVIAGGGPMQDSLKDNDNIEYMGIIPHELAYKFYEKIDVFVLASQTREFWKEQFGRVIIEAVASGKPVIGSSSGAVPEVMALLKMPYVFREDSVQELKACITKVGNDYHSGELEGIMKVSTHLAFEQFSHKKVALKILSFISEKTNV
jgi:glycosyltransferase involved in cell wall biosynthesis